MAFSLDNTDKVVGYHNPRPRPANKADADVWEGEEINEQDAAFDKIRNRIRGWINVKEHEAAGDGVSDDAPAIRAALAAASAGDVVFIPAGTYLLGEATVFDSRRHLLVIPSGVTLAGAGEGTVLRVAARDLDADNLVGTIATAGTSASPVSGVHVRDLVIDGNRAAHTGTKTTSNVEGVNLRYATDSSVRHVRVMNAEGDGIDVDGSSDCIVLGNRVSGCGGTGIHVSEGSHENLVAANVCSGNGATYDRSGIDQFSLAWQNSYVGNVCYDNHRNYHFPNSTDPDPKYGRYFFSPDNVSLGGSEDDLLEGTPAFTLPSKLPWGRDATASGGSSAAFGRDASAAGDRGLAAGRSASAAGTDATAVGSSASAALTSGTALGHSAQATGASTTAVGTATVASGTSTTAIGDRAAASGGGGALALGRQASAGHDRAVALGSNTATTVADQIAVGPRHFELVEHALSTGGLTDPLAPAADRVRLYARDNGAGKTEIVARFAGGIVVIATEP